MSKLVHANSIDYLKRIKENSIHLILSDIPYGISADTWDVLHSNKNSALLGCSPSQEKAGKVFKSRGKPLNGWSQEDKKIPIEYYNWCLSWSATWLKILKPGASVFIFAGRRFAHRCICALEDSGFIFKDMLSWNKTNAIYRAQRISKVFERRGDVKNAGIWKSWRLGNLRPTFEPILWFIKPYPVGTTLVDNVLKYSVGVYNEKMYKKFIPNCDNIISGIKYEKSDTGLHPTQKPLKLMKLLISLVTKKGQKVLDPFMGSGTTCLAAKELNRKYYGIEQCKEYYDIACKRLGIEI